MKSLRLLDRRAGYSLGALGLLLGMVVPAILPLYADASTVTSRSVAMSSSVAAASGVDYTVTFTPATSEAGAFIVMFFCNDSPIVGQSCGAPTGLSITASTLVTTASTSGASITGTRAANKLEIDDSTTGLTGASAASFTIHTLTNPTNPTDTTAGNGLYARIQTYANSTDADAGYADPTVTTNLVDNGGVAMAVTQGIGITAAVRETMTFCVSGVEPGPDCGAGAGTDPTTPSLTLGEGSPKALDSGHLSTGQDWAQLSTNAVNGATVSLKTDRSCGGLSRSAAPTVCDIAAAPNTGSDFTFGNAYFGVKLGSAASVSGAANPSGTLTPATGYTHYFMDYVSGNATGVGSTYGSALFTTGSAAVNNKDIPMTFGASVSNATPAGIYLANLSLIATGTF